MNEAGLQPARKSVAVKYASESDATKRGIGVSAFVEQVPYATPALFIHQKQAGEVLGTA